jgi:hypothetical protein
MIDEAVTNLRLQLRVAGFSPIPVEGKAPYMDGWQQKLDTSEAEIRLWPKVWHLAENTGILAKYSPGDDIDITDEDAADAVEHLAREHFEERGRITTRIGAWPKRLIPLRTDEPFTKLIRSFRAPDGTRHKIEILGDGQHWVCNGTHPGTGTPYRWTNGEPGRDFAREDLPYVRREDIERFLDAAVTLLDEEHGFTLVTGMADANGQAREAGEPLAAMSRVGAAVRVIPNDDLEWDDWNRIGMAIWAATSGSAEGFEVFDAWSSKSSKYDARATSKKWSGYVRSPPTRIGFGTLKYLADQADPTWEEALQDEPPADDPNDPGVESLPIESPCVYCGVADGTERPSAYGGAYLHERCEDAFVNQRLAEEGIAPLSPPPQAPDPKPQPKPKPNPSLLQIRWYGEADTNLERKWLVKDMLPETGVGLISGQWGTYKTFIALDLAVAVLTGETFAGYQVARRGGTLFIAAEGQSEVAIRLKGAIGNKSPMARAPFCWADTCPPLLNSTSEQILIATAKAAAQRMQAEWNLPLALIMIDTVNAAAGYAKAGDENDAALNGRLIARLNRLSQATGALVLGVDHFGKAVETGTRGSSAKEGNADVVLALIADKEINGTVTNTRMALRKLRAGSAGVELPFLTREIVLSVDQDGRSEKTLVIDWGAPPEAPTKGGKSAKDDWGRSKAVKLLRRTIMGLLAESGVEQKPWPDGPTVRALKVELLRTEFLKTYPAEGDTAKDRRDAKTLAFRRALLEAVNRGVVVTRESGGEDYVWLARAAEESAGLKEDR